MIVEKAIEDTTFVKFFEMFISITYFSVVVNFILIIVSFVKVFTTASD